MWNETLTLIDELATHTDTSGLYNSDVVKKISQDNGIYHKDNGLFHAINSMADASELCLSTGFNMWCQSTLSWYTSRPKNSHFDALHQDISSGKILGGSGLSNPFKTFSGLADIKLQGVRVKGGYKVSGTLPWVSNIAYGHYLAVVFENEKQQHVMGLVKCDEGSVKITQPNTFIALEATATVAVQFEDSFIEDSLIFSEDYKNFAPSIRAGFILLQCGMGLGLLHRVEKILTKESNNSENHVLATQALDIRKWIDDIELKIQAFNPIVEAEESNDSLHWIDVLRLRRDVTKYTLQAIEACMLHSGAKGYLKNSLAERTLREGYFVATITPSLKQLEIMLHD